MSPDQAEVYARELYGGHPAVAHLLLVATHGSTPERRARAALALTVLDPLVPLSVTAAEWLGRLLSTDSAAHVEEMERRHVERWAARWETDE